MKDIYKILEELGIKYVKYDHPAVFTCEEADQYYAKMEGGHSKNLFLRNKKGDRYYLVIVRTDKKADFKSLCEKLLESKLAFASPERMLNVLGLTPGSVTPFGLINDQNKVVTVVIDEDLWKYDTLNYHPNVNTATLGVNRDDFKKFLDFCGNEVRFMEL